MRKIGLVVAAFLVLVFLMQKSQSGRSPWYRFIAANDQLFAIEYAHAYGTEQGLYVTHDLGSTWHIVESPKKVCALAGNGEQLVVATSTGEVWHKKTGDMVWTKSWQSSAANPYYYSVLLSKSGDTFVVGKDAVLWINATGKLVHEFPKPSHLSDAGDLFVNASFANEEEQQLIVETNTYTVYILDLDSRNLSPWTDVEGSVLSGLNGPGRVRPMGSQFLLSHPSGIHISSGLLEPWKMLNATIRQDNTIDGNFCRDLFGHSGASEQWIVATNSGINLMEGANEVRTIYTDKPGEHHLIREFTQHEGYYFVSFARLASGFMGIRLSPDLLTWQPIRMETQ